MTRSRLFPPAFIGAALLLAIAAVGLEPAIAGFARHFAKSPIGLLVSLDEFDLGSLPSFRWAAEGSRYDTTIEDVDTEDVLRLVFTLDDPRRTDHRNLDVLLFVTYYDDPNTTIPHTPEVCARQSGTTVNAVSTIEVQLSTSALNFAKAGGGPEPRLVDARLVEMTDDVRKAVAYVLVSNGRVYHDRNQVRLAKARPGDRRFYVAKVEVATHAPHGEDYELAVERCKRLLAEALPQLMSVHFPSAEDVKR